MSRSEYYSLLPNTSNFAFNVTENDSLDVRFSANASESDVSETAYIVNYILYIIGVLVTSATVIGNVLVIIAVICEKRLRKVGNVFIINLAISDCLVGVFVSPLAITYDITGDWALGDIICDIWISVDVISCTASILNLCAIAYDRYKAISKPITYARQRTFTRAWCVVIFVWIYSVFIALPRFLGWKNNDEMGQSGKCFISREVGYTIFSTIGAFFLPLFVMLFFYYKIFCATCIRKRSWSSQRGHFNFITESERSEKKNKSPFCLWCKSLPCCSSRPTVRPNTTEQSTQTPSVCNIASPVETDDETRRESIDPEILAIFQMRQRSNRMLSNATMSSFGSTFYSSSDSSNTATTSFSESSDRSSSISTEGRDRSYSACTTGSRSFSSGTENIRRFSTFRGHRLSNPRHSTLQTEVIHEIANAQLEKTILETCRPDDPVQVADTVEMEETHDEASEDDKAIPKGRKSLKSSTFRRRNSRKSKKMAINQEKRAARTLGVVMGCFIMCWFPFFVVTLLRVICFTCYFHPLLIKSVSWLGYFNSACNPFIYTLFNKDFRNAFKKMSCCRSENIVYL